MRHPHISAFSALLIFATTVLVGLYTGVYAEGLPPDENLLQNKGYSPELKGHVGRQRLRQEWQAQATPYKSHKEQFFKNVWRNDWLGSLDEFGAPSFRD